MWVLLALSCASSPHEAIGVWRFPVSNVDCGMVVNGTCLIGDRDRINNLRFEQVRTAVCEWATPASGKSCPTLAVIQVHEREVRVVTVELLYEPNARTTPGGAISYLVLRARGTDTYGVDEATVHFVDPALSVTDARAGDVALEFEKEFLN